MRDLPTPHLWQRRRPDPSLLSPVCPSSLTGTGSSSRLDASTWSPSNGKQDHCWLRDAQVPLLYLTEPSAKKAHAAVSA